MKIIPLQDRVIVRRLEEERTSAGGIVIPDSAAEKPDQGIVVSVGPGKRDDSGKINPVELSSGQRVLFGKYAGTNVRIDDEELVVMREDDILATIDTGKKK